MIDYEKKAKVMSLGLCEKAKKLDANIYKLWNDGVPDIVAEEMIFCNENHCSFEDLEEARKINDANYHRVKRLKERIQKYLSMGECIWLTLTFNDNTLAKTTQEKRRRLVRDYLKHISPFYVANIDFGKENEREHYHAVVVGSYVDMNLWKKYGFAYTERIKNHLTTSVKLSKYVSKLTNHAIKETTKRAVYVYSR